MMAVQAGPPERLYICHFFDHDDPMPDYIIPPDGSKASGFERKRCKDAGGEIQRDDCPALDMRHDVISCPLS